MCFCNPDLRTPFCNSNECQAELFRKQGEDLAKKTSQRGARLQIMWQWLQTVNEATGIEPPKEFFTWFDSDGVPL